MCTTQEGEYYIGSTPVPKEVYDLYMEKLRYPETFRDLTHFLGSLVGYKTPGTWIDRVYNQINNVVTGVSTETGFEIKGQCGKTYWVRIGEGELNDG